MFLIQHGLDQNHPIQTTCICSLSISLSCGIGRIMSNSHPLYVEENLCEARVGQVNDGACKEYFAILFRLSYTLMR